jgi:hypothetical protein
VTLSIANASANLTESAFSINPQAGSVIVYGHGDWNATNPQGKTPTTGSGTATERRDAGDGATYGQYICDWEGTTTGAANYGTNNYTSLTVAKAACEIRSDSADVEIVSWAQVSNWFASAATSFTNVAWNSGDIIVVISMGENAGITTAPVPSNANLSFSSQASSTGGGFSECEIQLYTRRPRRRRKPGRRSVSPTPALVPVVRVCGCCAKPPVGLMARRHPQRSRWR